MAKPGIFTQKMLELFLEKNPDAYNTFIDHFYSGGSLFAKSPWKSFNKYKYIGHNILLHNFENYKSLTIFKLFDYEYAADDNNLI